MFEHPHTLSGWNSCGAELSSHSSVRERVIRVFVSTLVETEAAGFKSLSDAGGMETLHSVVGAVLLRLRDQAC